MPKDGLLLFASQDPMQMPGASVRFAEFHNRALTNDEVRKITHASIYSQWQSDAAKAQADLFNSLALQPLYKRPPFVWQEIAFISEFGDASVEATGIEGASSVFSAVRVLGFVARQMWDQQQAALDMLSAQEFATVERSLTMLDESTKLARLYEMSKKNPNQFMSFIRKVFVYTFLKLIVVPVSKAA